MQQTRHDGVARRVRRGSRARLGSARRAAPVLAAAVAALIVLALGPAARPAPTARPALAGAASWHLDGLPDSDRRVIAVDVAETIPAARQVLGLIAGSVSIDADARPCGPGIDACSYPEAAGAPTPWRVHLGPDNTSGSYPSQRFYVLHELGHAVWGLVLADADRHAFAGAVAQSLHHQRCRRVRDGRPCAPINELFADEFARWAGGFQHNMTGYQTPPLLGEATLARVVDHTLARSGGLGSAAPAAAAEGKIRTSRTVL